MFREHEGTKVVETDILEAALTNYDELKINVQKCSGSKDASKTLSSENHPIAVAAPKSF